jgi:hypothetical protein
VVDEEGNVFPRGARIAVCERSYRLLTGGAYQRDFVGIEPAEPREPVALCAPPGTRRPPADTKGGAKIADESTGSCC